MRRRKLKRVYVGERSLHERSEVNKHTHYITMLRRLRPRFSTPLLLDLLRRDLKVSATELRRDNLIVGSEVGQTSDRLLKVEDFVRGKAGKGGGFVQVTMRDIMSNVKITHKFASDERVETAELDTPSHYTLLYRDDELLYLMEDETMDQIEVALSMVDEPQQTWLQDGMRIRVQMLDGAAVMVQPPQKGTFEVTEASMAKSGDNLKFVTLENGERVRVPNYVEAGQRVVINLADGSFSSRSED